MQKTREHTSLYRRQPRLASPLLSAICLRVNPWGQTFLIFLPIPGVLPGKCIETWGIKELEGIRRTVIKMVISLWEWKPSVQARRTVVSLQEFRGRRRKEGRKAEKGRKGKQERKEGRERWHTYHSLAGQPRRKKGREGRRADKGVLVGRQWGRGREEEENLAFYITPCNKARLSLASVHLPKLVCICKINESLCCVPICNRLHYYFFF